MTTDSQHPRLLLIDDDDGFRADLRLLLGDRYNIREAATGHAGLEAVEMYEPQVVLLDLEIESERDGIEILRKLSALDNHPAVIMLTQTESVATVVEAIKAGATNYVCKPPNVDHLVNVINLALADADQRRRIAALEADVDRLHGELVAVDPESRRLLEEIDLVAPTEATVLITGECGTGKEMVARRIHARSKRGKGPFVAVNCGAVPAELIESELFGHEKGAFTGADRRRRGRFELAHGGTLFLDEIGDSPDALQVKLLRVLETREYTRVGSERPLISNARVVAATSRDLDQALADGDLRSELFYRLNVFRVHLLPLRRRAGDVVALAEHFLAVSSHQLGKRIAGFEPAALANLREREWPGNVRELRNAVERAAIHCRGERIDLPDLLHDTAGETYTLTYEEAKSRLLRDFKQRYLARQLDLAGGNVALAAERCGLKRQSLHRMLGDCDLDADRFRKR